MKLSVQKWGDSAAVCLPAELLGLLNVKLGDKLSVKVAPGGILLQAARPVYSLADLVALCDPIAPMPADMADWANMKPAGREV